MLLKRYGATALMAARGCLNEGLTMLLPGFIVRLVCLVPLLQIWRVLLADGVDTEVGAGQMLSYTLAATVLSELLLVKTQASSWNYEGMLQTLFMRPFSLFGQLIAQTVGGWLPGLVLFSLPLLAAAPLFGISIVPATLWFFPSLLLCISLGFAIDFLFACFTIRLSGMAWVGDMIRHAIASVLSGSVIPFALLPFHMGDILRFQPFASLGGAPLSLLTGIAQPGPVLLTQVFWNLLLWPCAFILFHHWRGELVSYGG